MVSVSLKLMDLRLFCEDCVGLLREEERYFQLTYSIFTSLPMKNITI